MEQTAIVLCRARRERRLLALELLESGIQTLLAIFTATGFLPVRFKPAHSVGSQLTQRLDELEEGAEHKGGVCGAHCS